MTDDDDDGEPARQERSDVGYGKPPKEHRFPIGKSGTPKGRPRKAHVGSSIVGESLATQVICEAGRDIKVNENGRVINSSVINLMVRSLAISSVKGHLPSTKEFTKIYDAAVNSPARDAHATLEAAHHYKALVGHFLADQSNRGMRVPNLLPHPDEIYADIKADKVIFNGPMDERENALRTDLIEPRDCPKTLIKLLWKMQKEASNTAKQTEALNAMITVARLWAALIDDFLPDEATRRTAAFDLASRRQGRLHYPDIMRIVVGPTPRTLPGTMTACEGKVDRLSSSIDVSLKAIVHDHNHRMQKQTDLMTRIFMLGPGSASDSVSAPNYSAAVRPEARFSAALHYIKVFETGRPDTRERDELFDSSGEELDAREHRLSKSGQARREERTCDANSEQGLALRITNEGG